MTQWRDIPGYEGWYQVSNDGQVRSVERIDAKGRRRFSQIMKPWGQKHLQVRLTKDGVAKGPLIHRLMLLAFVGPPPFEGAMGLHGDGNYLNNALSNLRWGTGKDNYDDSLKHGNPVLIQRRWGSPDSAVQDRAFDLRRNGLTIPAIAKWLSIGYGTAWKLVSRSLVGVAA